MRDPAALTGRALRERDLVGEETWLGSEVYHDLGLPNGVAQILSASLASLPAGTGPFLAFFRAPDAPLSDDAVVQAYQRFLPHLQRAVRLRQRAGPPPLPGWSLAMLDQMAAGLFLLDGDGRVLHANEPRRAMLDKRDGVSLATVRSQVQSIFGRLGVRRQSDIVRLVAEVSALPGPDMAGCIG